MVDDARDKLTERNKIELIKATKFEYFSAQVFSLI